MIRTLYRTEDGELQIGLALDQIGVALQDPGGLLWLDFEAEPPSVCEPVLLETFGFHPLAVSDALDEAHVPKVDDWGEYLYVVLHAIVYNGHDDGTLDTHEMDAFLGKHYLVTHHEQPIAAVERVWELCQRDERHLKQGADHLLYRLADELAASYMPIVEKIDEAVDEIEDQLFTKPAPITVQRLFTLKRSLLHMRRIIAPQREVLNKLARDDYAVIDAKDRVFFRDVYDHLVRLHDINESLRDLVSGALETYLSVVNNRMNEIMKTLTIITTLFMPLSFVAGFFGMNFFLSGGQQAVWVGKPTVALVVVIMIATPISMYLWMRRRALM